MQPGHVFEMAAQNIANLGTSIVSGLGNPVPGTVSQAIQTMEGESGASRNWAGAQADTLQGSGVSDRVFPGGAERRLRNESPDELYRTR